MKDEKMISVEIESEAFLKEELCEDCIFCGKETRYWHKDSNTPICRVCAEVNSIHDMNRVKYQKD